MNKRLSVLALLPRTVAVLSASADAKPLAPVPLWPEGQVPGALGVQPTDTPTLTPFLPADNMGGVRPAMVICPGGGYGMLAGHEGADYAQYLNRLGIACFVLRYRLGAHGYRHPAMLNDAARAVRLVRARAKEWNVDPARVGIMGSSAGGHLASTLLTYFDAGKPDDADPIERQSSRPDLGVLCYAVISMRPDLTHEGSRRNLLGENPSAALVDLLSNEKQVTDQTPPCFLWHTGEDDAVKVENALRFASALHAHKVPFDLHVYERGRHGIGLMDKSPFANAHPWAADLTHWLKGRGWVR